MNNNVNNQQPMRQPLKQCKYCKQPIAAKASVCPYCHKSQSSAGLVVILVLLSFLGCFLILAFVIAPIMQGYQNRENEINNDNYEVITEAPTEPTTAEPVLLYDENNVKIYFTGISYVRGNTKLNVYIENNSDKNLMIQVDKFTVNDFVVNTLFSSHVPIGKKNNDDITILKSSLEKNNITEFNSVEFTFNIINDDDWSDNVNTEPIKLEW